MNPRVVKLLILDVDGVLTDGRLYLSDDGTETKCFHVHDGAGLVQMNKIGIRVAVISGRASPATEERLRELGIDNVILGCDDKYAAAHSLIQDYGFRWNEVVCVGDDEADVPLLEAAGLGVAVADSRLEARNAADWITPNPGGMGAVRDVCDWLLRKG